MKKETTELEKLLNTNKEKQEDNNQPITKDAIKEMIDKRLEELKKKEKEQL